MSNAQVAFRARARERLQGLPSLAARREPREICEWAETEFLVRDEESFRYAPIRLFPWQARILADITTPVEGQLPYQTVIFSTVKKSGKSTIGALLATWLGCEFVPGDGEVYFLANTREQAAARVFKFVRRALLHNPRLQIDTERGTQRKIALRNGTEFIPLAAVAATAAGGNQDGVFYDELWSWQAGSDQEAFEELTPPPTRPNCMQVITSYAGYLDQPGTLYSLYQTGLEGRRLYADGYRDPRDGKWYDTPLPVWVRDDVRLYMYWDSGVAARRLPWQTEQYYATEWAKVENGDMSLATFRRLHLNEWGESVATYIEAGWWRACCAPGFPVDLEVE